MSDHTQHPQSESVVPAQLSAVPIVNVTMILEVDNLKVTHAFRVMNPNFDVEEQDDYLTSLLLSRMIPLGMPSLTFKGDLVRREDGTFIRTHTENKHTDV